MNKNCLLASIVMLCAFDASAMSVLLSPQMQRFTSNWMANGYSFDGVARLLFDDDGSITDGSTNVCSGTLLSGGKYVLTAAHCADNFDVMRVDFGVNNNVATETRRVSRAIVDPTWTGLLKQGNDLALLELATSVTNISGFNLSTTLDVGKLVLMMGYGTTTTGGSDVAPNWNDWGWGHWGINRYDVTTMKFMDAVTAAGIDVSSVGKWSNNNGEEYVADFDGGTDLRNTISRIPLYSETTLRNGLVIQEYLGPAFNSDKGISFESLITGGDSGGGDFIWTGSEWLLSGVHSWGWQFCDGRLDPNCDSSITNDGSYGDLMGSTAVYSHLDWIKSFLTTSEVKKFERPLNSNDQLVMLPMSVPEPTSLALLGLGLSGLGAIRRFKQ